MKKTENKETEKVNNGRIVNGAFEMSLFTFLRKSYLFKVWYSLAAEKVVVRFCLEVFVFFFCFRHHQSMVTVFNIPTAFLRLMFKYKCRYAAVFAVDNMSFLFFNDDSIISLFIVFIISNILINRVDFFSCTLELNKHWERD